MRYTSAVVLSTLAAGQAAAAHNARHASFHARRQGEAKRGQYDNLNVDWKAVSYDLSGVDWSSVFNKPAATPTPTPQAVNAAEAKTSAAPQAAYTPAPVQSSQQSKPSQTESSNPIEKIGNDILKGVEALCSKLGISKTGVNSKTNNGNIWLGSDSPWTANFTNDGSDDAVLFCWVANGFSGMSLNVNQPAISVNLAVGETQPVAFAEGVPAACAPAFPNTKLALFGGLDTTWWEVTYGPSGAFDVSRNVNMNGAGIKSKGSKCTSDMDTCVFKCTGDVTSCEKGYDLINCGAGSGGGGGYDSVMQGTGGGCSMGNEKEHVEVTFY